MRNNRFDILNLKFFNYLIIIYKMMNEQKYINLIIFIYLISGSAIILCNISK